MSSLTTEPRNDLHLTSTGVALGVRKPVQFPFDKFKGTLTHALPPSLAPETTDVQQQTSIYQTTTATTHGYQPSGTILEQPICKKAPGSYKVHYTLDTIDKLNVKPWRKPLEMGNQCSEMKANYQGKPETISTTISYAGNPQPPTLADHFVEGPTKGLAPAGFNKELKGRKFVPQNQAILDRLEPYMTTNNWYHRTFSVDELNKYPKKDVATYWQCEDYPKAWGHGMKVNPLPRKLARTDPGPMRDRSIFLSRTTIPRLPTTSQPITSGLCSVYAGTYTNPSGHKQKELLHCPVQSTSPTQDGGGEKTLVVCTTHA